MLKCTSNVNWMIDLSTFHNFLYHIKYFVAIPGSKYVCDLSAQNKSQLPGDLRVSRRPVTPPVCTLAGKLATLAFPGAALTTTGLQPFKALRSLESTLQQKHSSHIILLNVDISSYAHVMKMAGLSVKIAYPRLGLYKKIN